MGHAAKRELLERELQRRDEALLQQQRLRMLGEVAGSVAHDLASTLRALAMRLRPLQEDARVRRSHQRALRALAEGIRSASQVVDPLREFARSGSLQVGAVRLDRIVRQAASLLELEAQAEKIALRVEVDVPELPPVRGSQAVLSHLFLNLLRNARDAMPAGARVRVIARASRGKMQVRVIDEGKGIRPEHFQHLFEPFFTTKRDGAGLGLWIAAITLRRLGGSIRALRRRRGATFVVTIPLAGRRSRGRA